MFKESPLNFLSALALTYFFLVPLSIFWIEFHSYYLLLFLFHFVWFGLSSSLFYHRVLTHRGAEIHPVLELFFLLGGSISLSGSPINWAAVHRFHHAHPDCEEDPHSPLHGRFWSYMGWAAHQDLKKIEELKKENAQDLLSQNLYTLFDRDIMTIFPHILYTIILFLLFGLGGVLWSLTIAGLFSYNFHWMLIASFCHDSKFGYRRFETNDKSRNLPWLSFLSFGESLHNNHHQNQRSIKLKSTKTEFDLTFFMVKFFEQIGLAKNLIVVDFEKKGSKIKHE